MGRIHLHVISLANMKLRTRSLPTTRSNLSYPQAYDRNYTQCWTHWDG